MKITNTVRLCLWYVKDLILFLVSSEYMKRGWDVQGKVQEQFWSPDLARKMQ